MQKLAKRLSVFMVAIMTLSVMLNFVIAAPAKAAQGYPQVRYAEEPKLEYTVGDRVQFNLHAPNYGGRVQYRVVLWNDETKSYRDLWTSTTDRYYDKWMPYGNNIFTLGWVINEPGHYRITIYAKRAGVVNNETYLKGFNCDSYMESDSFVVKAKPVEVKPDVASEKIELSSATTSPAAINGHMSKSAQAIVGKDYELAVKVDKPGVKVMFQLDAPAGSLNKDEVLEAVSGSDNVAKVSYKRLYADADYVTAYVAAAPTVRTAMKVYWGVDKILSITATEDDATKASNGNVKSYKVTLKNPITGERMRDRELRVLVRENIDAPNNAALSTALITNPYSGMKSTTYQRMNNIITGGLNQETVILKTNDNGEAAFTVTGVNTKATPVVFFDSDWFYGNPDDSAWGGLQDNSQFKPSYAGNDNLRWDATELQVEPATVTFNPSTFTFEQKEISDPYTAVCEPGKLTSGRTYTVTVKDSEGKPYKNGLVNIAIHEMIDTVYGTNTNAKIIKTGTSSSNLTSIAPAIQVQVRTSSSGVVMFTIASDKVNDMATPIIWIDQDTASVSNGQRNGILEPADPQKLLSQTTFVVSAVKSGSFYAELDNGNLNMSVDENDDVISIDNEPVNFFYNIKNQNGSLWMPVGAFANLTYTIENIGNGTVKVFRPVAGNASAQGITVDNLIGWPGNGEYDTIDIPNYQTRTISFRTTSATGNYIKIVASGSAMVKVTANANLVSETNTSGAWLAPASAIASWIKTTPVADYTAAKSLFSSTVYGFNIAENYVIAKPVTDTSRFIKIPYTNLDEYTVQTQQHQNTLNATIVNFEEQISLEDGLTYRLVADEYNNGNLVQVLPDYFSLYNADNSYDNESDELETTNIQAQIFDGREDVTTYTQTTYVDVMTGTDSSFVGNYHVGNKVFTTTSSMSTAEVANMIANASPIQIGGVNFRVETVGNLGRMKFTAVIPTATAINLMPAFQDPNNTGITVQQAGATSVNDNTVAGLNEMLVVTVNTSAMAERTIQIKFNDGSYASFEKNLTVLATDTAVQIAAKIDAEFRYWLAGKKILVGGQLVPAYSFHLDGRVFTLTKLVNENAGFSVTIK